jgi:hypothetical protein
MGEWRYSATCSLTLALDGGECSASCPQPLYPQGKSPWYPLDRRLGGPQSQSGCGGEEKNSQPLPGLKSLIIQPIAQHYTTELSQILTAWKDHWNQVNVSIQWPSPAEWYHPSHMAAFIYIWKSGTKHIFQVFGYLKQDLKGHRFSMMAKSRKTAAVIKVAHQQNVFKLLHA